MLNIDNFLQQYVISQLARMFLVALILIALLIIFNIFFLKKPFSHYLAIITLLPLAISTLIFIFSPFLRIATGGLNTVALVWLPFFVNSYYIIASLNKENRIITNTKEPQFLLRKELSWDVIIQTVVIVISITPLYAILPLSNYISLVIGGLIAITSIWVSNFALIRKI